MLKKLTWLLNDFADLGLGVLALPTMRNDGPACESKRAAVEYEDRLGVEELSYELGGGIVKQHAENFSVHCSTQPPITFENNRDGAPTEREVSHVGYKHGCAEPSAAIGGNTKRKT
ncbi:major facilitator superfamily protein [Actinidia rufa]|uniref:Major facilitator superfamily protein n=1 Tax=Actinidia rufa TaxID=165716 RepID=A0A7J0DJY7_9ERIC|nr:major facilitator superfamily protein [Actinidia rufa]